MRLQTNSEKFKYLKRESISNINIKNKRGDQCPSEGTLVGI